MNDKTYKWFALGLLWVAFFLQQGTRQLFGPSIGAIMHSTQADKVAVGMVGTVFAFVYGISVPFAGIAADIFRRKWMVTIGVAIFCLGIFLSGFISTVGMLLVTYGILNGVGQTFYYPSATSLISQLHQESRATAISILQLGLYIGIVGCGTLAGYFSGEAENGDVAKWRVTFYVFGALGLLWAAVLAVFLKDTKPVSSASDKPMISAALKAVFSKPTALCVIVGLAMMIYVDIGFKNWMPTFLTDSFLNDNPFLRKWAGFHAVAWHYLGAVVGVLIGSRFGDKVAKKRPGIRLELGAAGLALAIPFIVLMAYADTFVACVAAMTAFGFFRGIYDSNFMASFFDVVTPRYHASGVGIMMCMAFLFGSLSSTVLPCLQGAFGRTAGLASLGVFYALGAIVILLGRVFFLSRDRVA